MNTDEKEVLLQLMRPNIVMKDEETAPLYRNAESEDKYTYSYFLFDKKQQIKIPTIPNSIFSFIVKNRFATKNELSYYKDYQRRRVSILTYIMTDKGKMEILKELLNEAKDIMSDNVEYLRTLTQIDLEYVIKQLTFLEKVKIIK